MKSLSLHRPLLIFVIGAPGAGKSFFANQFADMFGAPIVSYDKLHHRLFTQPTYGHDESVIVMDVLKQQIEQLARTRKVFLVDGGVSARSQRFEIEKICKPYGYDSMIVWVQTDEMTAKKRATSRSNRRKGDENNDSITFELFDSLAAKVTAPGPSESAVVISGRHTFASQAKSVLRRLVSPRETGLAKPTERTPAPASSTEKSNRRNIVLS